jgi:hypothetical protein
MTVIYLLKCQKLTNISHDLMQVAFAKEDILYKLIHAAGANVE